MSFSNFGSGVSHSFGGRYVELTPHERIRYTDRFDDPNLPGKMQVTNTLRTVACGTELQENPSAQNRLRQLPGMDSNHD